MERETLYSFGRTVDLSFEQAVARVKEALGRQSFGILTEIDVTAKFKEKLGLAFQPYRILGACNPAMAHRVLGVEIDLGVLLPCNVVVYTDDAGHTHVMAMDPEKGHAGRRQSGFARDRRRGAAPAGASAGRALERHRSRHPTPWLGQSTPFFSLCYGAPCFAIGAPAKGPCR